MTESRDKANLYMQGSLKSFHERHAVSGLNQSQSTISQNRALNQSPINMRQQNLQKIGIFSENKLPEQDQISQDHQIQHTLHIQDASQESHGKEDMNFDRMMTIPRDGETDDFTYDHIQHPGHHHHNHQNYNTFNNKSNKNPMTQTSSRVRKQSIEQTMVHSNELSVNDMDEQATQKIYSSYTPDEKEREYYGKTHMKTTKIDNMNVSSIFNQVKPSPSPISKQRNTNQQMLLRAHQKPDKPSKKRKDTTSTIDPNQKGTDYRKGRSLDQQFQKLQKQMMKYRATDNPFLDYVQEELSFRVTQQGYKPTKIREKSPLQMLKNIQHKNGNDIHRILNRTMMDGNTIKQQITDLSITNRRTGHAHLEELKTWKSVLDQTSKMPSRHPIEQISNKFEIRNRESNFLRKMKMDQQRFSTKPLTQLPPSPNPIKKHYVLKKPIESQQFKGDRENLIINEDSQLDSFEDIYDKENKVNSKSVVRGARKEQGQQVSSFGDSFSNAAKTTFHNRKKTLDPISRPPPVSIPGANILDQVNQARTNFLKNQAGEDYFDNHTIQKKDISGKLILQPITELLVEPQKISTPPQITPIKDSRHNTSGDVQNTLFGEYIGSRNPKGQLYLNTQVQGSYVGSPIRSHISTQGNQTPNSNVTIPQGFGSNRGTFKYAGADQPPTNIDNIGIVGKTTYLNQKKKIERQTLSKKSRTKPIVDSPIKSKDSSSEMPALPKVGNINQKSKEGGVSDIGVKEIVLDQTPAYSSLESNQNHITFEGSKKTPTLDEKLQKVGGGKILPAQMFDTKPVQSLQKEDRLLDKILSQNLTITEKAKATESVDDTLDQSLNLKIQHDFGLSTHAKQTPNNKKEKQATNNAYKNEELQHKKKFRKEVPAKKQHFNFLLDLPYNSPFTSNDNTLDSQVAMKDLKVVMDEDKQAMTLVGENPFQVSKKPLKSIERIHVSEGKKKLSLNLHAIKKLVQQTNDMPQSKGVLHSVSNISSAENIQRINVKEHLTSESIMIKNSKNRKVSHNGSKENLNQPVNDDLKKLMEKPKKVSRSRRSNIKPRFGHASNTDNDIEHDASYSSPESMVGCRMEKMERIPKLSSRIGNYSGLSQHNIQQSLAPSLQKLQQQIEKSIEHFTKLQLTEIQMFKDMKLLPQQLSNLQIMELLKENGMGQDEMLELDELRESCAHLIDIEQKLIQEVKTPITQINDQKSSQPTSERRSKRISNQNQPSHCQKNLEEFRRSAIIITDKIYSRLKQMGFDVGGAIKVKEMRLIGLEDGRPEQSNQVNVATGIGPEAMGNKKPRDKSPTLIPVDPPQEFLRGENSDPQSIQQMEATGIGNEPPNVSGSGSPDILQTQMTPQNKQSILVDKMDNRLDKDKKKKKKKMTGSIDELKTGQTTQQLNNTYFGGFINEVSERDRQSPPFANTKQSGFKRKKSSPQSQTKFDFVVTNGLNSDRGSPYRIESPDPDSRDAKRISIKDKIETDLTASAGSVNDSKSKLYKTVPNHKEYQIVSHPPTQEQYSTSKYLDGTEPHYTTFQHIPGAKESTSKKFQPMYTFRNGIDLVKMPDLKQKSVLRLLKESSLNELGNKQFQITNRIKEISKLLPGKQMNYTMSKVDGKEQKINDEIREKVYKNLPKKIESARSHSPSPGFNSNSHIGASTWSFLNESATGLGGVKNMRDGQSKYISSLQYSQPDSLIIDNRPTSLFRDYYKVIGSRYKFKLEDLLIQQKDQKLIPSLQNYRNFKDKLSAFNVLPTATNQPYLVNYVKYNANIGVVGEAKKKLASRQRKRNGANQVKRSAAIFERDSKGNLVEDLEEPQENVDRVSTQILRQIFENYQKDIFNPPPSNLVKMRSSMKDLEAQRAAMALTDGLELSMSDINVYPQLDHSHMESLIKRYNSKIDKELTSQFPLLGLKQGDYMISPGFTLEKVQEEIMPSLSKVGSATQSKDKVNNPITAYKRESKTSKAKLEKWLFSQDSEAAMNMNERIKKDLSPGSSSPRNLLSVRYNQQGSPESLKSQDLPANQKVLSQPHLNSGPRLTEGQAKGSAIMIPSAILDDHVQSKIKSIFEIQRGEQKIRIDDPHQQFQQHSLLMNNTTTERVGQITLDPSNEEETQQPPKGTPKLKTEVAPKPNMLPPSTIKTEALVKQATPPGHLHIKNQIARDQLIKRFNWDIVDAYGKLGQIMKAKVASGLTPSTQKDIGALEGQKIKLNDKLPSKHRESPQLKEQQGILQLKKSQGSCASVPSIKERKRKLPDHGNLDDSESDSSHKQTENVSPTQIKKTSFRPKSQVKRSKKSILLKNLHEKSSTMYLHKTREKNNADLSNVSDSPHQKQRMLGGFGSPGKSSIKRKPSKQFEFGSQSRFFTDNSPSQRKDAQVSPGEKLTLLQRVASPIDQLMFQGHMQISGGAIDPQMLQILQPQPQAHSQQPVAPIQPFQPVSKEDTNEGTVPTKMIVSRTSPEPSDEQRAQPSEPTDPSRPPIAVKDEQTVTATRVTFKIKEGPEITSEHQLMSQTMPLPQSKHQITPPVAGAKKPEDAVEGQEQHLITDQDEFESRKIIQELNMFEQHTNQQLRERGSWLGKNIDDKSSSMVTDNAFRAKDADRSGRFKPSALSSHKMDSPRRQAGSPSSHPSEQHDWSQRNNLAIRGVKVNVLGGGFSRNPENVQRVVKHQTKAKGSGAANGKTSIIVRTRDLPSGLQLIPATRRSLVVPGADTDEKESSINANQVMPKQILQVHAVDVSGSNQEPTGIVEAEEDLDLSADQESLERVRKLQGDSVSATRQSGEMGPQNATMQDIQHFIPAPEQQNK